MPDDTKLKLMVASTVYHFEDQLRQICRTLESLGYEVWNSHIGTMPTIHPGRSNLDNCVAAAQNCDVFLGIIRPFYGSGIIGPRSITHEEFLAAIKLSRPRWFLVDRDVAFARQLLKHLLAPDGTRPNLKLEKNSFMDDLRVIELYRDALQENIPLEERKGHWVQEFYRMDEALTHIVKQFGDTEKIREICKEMNRP